MKWIKKLSALALSDALNLALLTGCGSYRPPAASQLPDDVPSNPPTVIEPAFGTFVIAEQGIFSAGGITVTSEGTFDPEN